MKRATAVLLLHLLLIAAVPAQPRESLLLSFVGDLMAHSVNYEIKGYSHIYDGIRDLLLTDDLTFANLEMVVDPSLPRASYPRFNNHPDYIKAAVDAGIDVFSLANNHAFDYGPVGVRATLASLEALAAEERGRGRSLWYNGARDSPSVAWAPADIDIKGWRIGFLAVTQFSNEWVTTPLLAVVDYNSQAQREEFLRRLRTLAPRYDLLIVSYHGDSEYSSEPDPEKERFFHSMLEAGVHIVYSHHPHVIQPCELVEVGGEQRLILYSTGNFLAGQSVRADPAKPDGLWARTGDTMVFQAVVRPGNPGPSVSRVDLVPAYQSRSPATGQIVINAMETLAHRRGAWGDFYRERLAIARQYMRRNPERESRHFAR